MLIKSFKWEFVSIKIHLWLFPKGILRVQDVRIMHFSSPYKNVMPYQMKIYSFPLLPQEIPKIILCGTVFVILSLLTTMFRQGFPHCLLNMTPILESL